MRVRVLVPVLVLVALFSACGGSDHPPEPLSHNLDDMYIASVPVDAKQSVINAKQSLDVAKMERAKIEADYGEVKTQIDIAKNEAAQASLEADSARAEKEQADKSYEVARQNNAERAMRTAELGRRAADAKIGFLGAKQDYLKDLLRVAQHNVYLREAKYEMEKARVAQANNIKPPGFDVSLFEQQYKARIAASQHAKAKGAGPKKAAEDRRKEWNERELEYMTARGKTGTPDSARAGVGMAPTPEPTGAGDKDTDDAKNPCGDDEDTKSDENPCDGENPCADENPCGG